MKYPVMFSFNKPDGFDTIFCLKSYPEIRFKFQKDIKIGTPFEDQTVPVLLKITIEPRVKRKNCR